MRNGTALVVLAAMALAGCSSQTGSSEELGSVSSSSSVTAAVPTVPTVPASTTTVGRTTTTEVVETTATTVPLAALQGLELEELATDFRQPVVAVAPPGDDRLFVVERDGRIRILGVAEPFLDIDDQVNSEDGIEPGLLGLAFHPNYEDTGLFYVYYYRADRPQTQLSSFKVSSDPNVADATSERELMSFDQPTNRHNGGMLKFDAADRLFVSLGEGGDASTHAQDPRTPLGAILRLALTSDNGVEPAADNPFEEPDGAPEVWAYGFRNPWRFDIDAVEALLYVGDVGHEDWEEIDVISSEGEGGDNLGWLEMEGTHCFRRGCEPDRYTAPVLEYSHTEGCSVTGGVVYRGSAIPELEGHYLYADWCGGWIRSFRFVDGQVTEEMQRFTDVGQVNGFGTDSSGEVYVLTYEGRISRLVARR